MSKETNRLNGICIEQARELADLRDEVTRLRDDKKRIDFLQATKGNVGWGCSANHPVETCGFACLPDWEEGVWGDDYRQAIDNAITRHFTGN